MNEQEAVDRCDDRSIDGRVNQRWRCQLANLSRLSLMWILTHFSARNMLIIPAMQKNRCL